MVGHSRSVPSPLCSEHMDNSLQKLEKPDCRCMLSYQPVFPCERWRHQFSKLGCQVLNIASMLQIVTYLFLLTSTCRRTCLTIWSLHEINKDKVYFIFMNIEYDAMDFDLSFWQFSYHFVVILWYQKFQILTLRKIDSDAVTLQASSMVITVVVEMRAMRKMSQIIILSPKIKNGTQTETAAISKFSSFYKKHAFLLWGIFIL